MEWIKRETLYSSYISTFSTTFTMGIWSWISIFCLNTNWHLYPNRLFHNTAILTLSSDWMFGKNIQNFTVSLPPSIFVIHPWANSFSIIDKTKYLPNIVTNYETNYINKYFTFGKKYLSLPLSTTSSESLVNQFWNCTQYHITKDQFDVIS